jgi:hypothetical protein
MPKVYHGCKHHVMRLKEIENQQWCLTGQIQVEIKKKLTTFDWIEDKEETLRDSSLTELDFTQNYSRSKQNWYVITKKGEDPIGLFKFDTIPAAGKQWCYTVF